MQIIFYNIYCTLSHLVWYGQVISVCFSPKIDDERVWASTENIVRDLNGVFIEMYLCDVCNIDEFFQIRCFDLKRDEVIMRDSDTTYNFNTDEINQVLYDSHIYCSAFQE